ncbi:LysM peptidoglycan-binding domain-containing protein [Halobacteriovorax sp. YZS-1-1]|uniref:LysM peptidoglycan-binding domain-containing protein n=1 Tax=unclassified Halobacteriovorax TaxID=2639665 RepID=UPI00399A1A38
MKSNSILSSIVILLTFQSCSFDSYNLVEQLGMEESKSEEVVVSEDEMVFDLGEVTAQKEHSILRSDSIFEDVPKTKLIEKEISFNDIKRGPASADEEAFDYYVVKQHDTAMKIAFYLYKDIRRWKDIKRLNGTTNLFTGQKIKVPVVPEVLDYTRPEGDPYLIKKDDTLGRISQKVYDGRSRYWINIWDNNKEVIDDYDLIFPGFTLYYKDYQTVRKEYHEVRKKYDFSNPKRRDISSIKN